MVCGLNHSGSQLLTRKVHFLSANLPVLVYIQSYSPRTLTAAYCYCLLS